MQSQNEENTLTLSQNYNKLKSMINLMEDDYGKFEKKGIKVSAAKFRATLLSTKKLCDTLRKQVQVMVKASVVPKAKQVLKEEPVKIEAAEIKDVIPELECNVLSTEKLLVKKPRVKRAPKKAKLEETIKELEKS
tara:strand:- start:1297 stop:1701 length:405 start_codon:yes stop_codon:yes gene_type:complete